MSASIKNELKSKDKLRELSEAKRCSLPAGERDVDAFGVPSYKPVRQVGV